jgi:hypothetical protein
MDKTILKKKNTVGGVVLPGVKAFYIATAIKTGIQGEGGGGVGGKGGSGGRGGEMTQALYAHMNNKTIKKRLASREGKTHR